MFPALLTPSVIKDEEAKREAWASLPWLKNSTFTEAMFDEARAREAALSLSRPPRSTSSQSANRISSINEKEVVELSDDSEEGLGTEEKAKDDPRAIDREGSWKADSYPLLLTSVSKKFNKSKKRRKREPFNSFEDLVPGEVKDLRVLLAEGEVEDLEPDFQLRQLPTLKPREERLRLLGGDIIGVFDEAFHAAFVEPNTLLKVSGLLRERVVALADLAPRSDYGPFIGDKTILVLTVLDWKIEKT